MSDLAIYIGYSILVFIGISLPLSECILSSATIGWNVIGVLLDMVLTAVAYVVEGIYEAKE